MCLSTTARAPERRSRSTSSTPTATTTSSTPTCCTRPPAACSRARLHAQGHARQPRQPGGVAPGPGDAEQRQPAGPGRADQQGLEPDLRGVRAVDARAAAGVHPDPGGGRRGAGRADHRGRPGFNGYASTSSARTTSRSRSRRSTRATSPTRSPARPRSFPQKAGKAVPFYGSLSHGLDKQVPVTRSSRRTGTSSSRAPPYRRARARASSAATASAR